MTPIELIKKATDICEAATPGPYLVFASDECRIMLDIDSELTYVEATESDMELFATARTLVPELAAALEASMQERDEAREKLQTATGALSIQREWVEGFAENIEIERLRADGAERERDEALSKVAELEADYAVARTSIDQAGKAMALYARQRDEARAELSEMREDRMMS